MYNYNYVHEKFIDVISFEEKIESIPDIVCNFNYEEESKELFSNFDGIPNYGKEKNKFNNNISIDKNDEDKKGNNDNFFFTLGFNFSSLFNSTNFKSDSNKFKDIDLTTNEQKNKKKGKIFKILKDNKNRGRIRNNSNLVGKHNKFSEDNIIRKFKGRFTEKCRVYINKEYKAFFLTNEHEAKKEKILLQRISPELSRKITKDDNLKWLKTKLYQVFSEDVSGKCSLYDLDYNKQGIKNLFRENKAKNVISILNRSVREMIEDFILNKIPGFGSLDDELKYLEEKMKNTDEQENIKTYLHEYRNIALNFEIIFKKKHARKNK